ncbi:MAG: lysophospholipid acyltransferase family protein [Selenomonadaceae bacterium]
MLYGILRLSFTAFFKLLFRCEVRGSENMPLEGGVIMAANHLSNLDPPLAGTFSPRPISYMAKQELFDIPVFGPAIRQLHAFPVKRGAADRGAIKAALQLLQEGKCLGLFPEGTRSKDGRIHKPEAGIALIAAKAGVPVVPTAIIGTDQVFSRENLFPRLRIVYGKPMVFSGDVRDKEALQAFSQEIMDQIGEMIKLNKKAN